MKINETVSAGKVVFEVIDSTFGVVAIANTRAEAENKLRRYSMMRHDEPAE